MGREVGTGERKLIRCREWSDVKSKYQKEVISLVESCLELDPVRRPEFSEICDALTTCKSNLQDLERIVANLQKISVITGICMLFHFLHYAFAASITVVILVILTRNWPWFKFMSTFPAQILIETYKGVRGWLAWTKEYTISAARKSNSNVAEYHLKID